MAPNANSGLFLFLFPAILETLSNDH